MGALRRARLRIEEKKRKEWMYIARWSLLKNNSHTRIPLHPIKQSYYNFKKLNLAIISLIMIGDWSHVRRDMRPLVHHET
jgi:hypothetical protein